MIVYTFSEEQVLNELVDDYADVKKHIKNRVKKEIAKLQKTGKPISDDDDFVLDIKSPRNNRWFAIIGFTPKEKVLWRCDMCCIVESEKRTKDYYILRGISDSPYFIKLISHAVKRFRERGGRFGKFLDEYGPEFFANILICPHETIVGMKYKKTQYYEIMAKLGLEEETDEETSHIFELMRGVYFGHRTDNGNYIFKTYISNLMSLEPILKSQKINTNDHESFISYMLIYPHQYYNRHLWDKENLDRFLYSQFDKDEELDFTSSKILILKP